MRDNEVKSFEDYLREILDNYFKDVACDVVFDIIKEVLEFLAEDGVIKGEQYARAIDKIGKKIKERKKEYKRKREKAIEMARLFNGIEPLD